MVVQVDTSKWEKIQFRDIVDGDEILAVRHSSDSLVGGGSLEGTAKAGRTYPFEIGGWPVAADGLRDLIVYRRRPPFVLPEKSVGAVVQANGEDDTYTFVLVDPEDAISTWVETGDSENWYSSEEIMKDFTNHRLLSEGVRTLPSES